MVIPIVGWYFTVSTAGHLPFRLQSTVSLLLQCISCELAKVTVDAIAAEMEQDDVLTSLGITRVHMPRVQRPFVTPTLLVLHS